MQLQMDKLDHCLLLTVKKIINTINKQHICRTELSGSTRNLPGFGELDIKPSIRSTIEAPPPEVVCAAGEGEGEGESPSNMVTGALFS